MSESKSASNGKQCITLLTTKKSYHITLLAKFLVEATSAECAFSSPQEPIPEESKLLLLDCNHISAEDLNALLRQLCQNQGESAIALLNAQYNSEYENLLNWPCIYGIFYLDTEEEQLVHGIQQLLKGDYWVPRRLLHHFFNKHRRSHNGGNVTPSTMVQLTNREKEILRMIKDGLSNLAVSESLSLSEHTVKSHLYNIYKKIGVRNRMEAGNWARTQQDLDAL